MNQLTPFSRKREFLKSMETEWQTLLKNQAARALSVEEQLMPEKIGQIVRWTLVGLGSGSQTKMRHPDVEPRHDS